MPPNSFHEEKYFFFMKINISVRENNYFFS